VVGDGPQPAITKGRVMTEEIKCPSCKSALNGELVALIKERQQVRLTIAPDEGVLLTAKEVGKAIISFAEIFKSIEEKTIVHIEKIETDESGKIDILFLVLSRAKTK
jgi:NMD protein affecting ribosome stability and mRNA decay